MKLNNYKNTLLQIIALVLFCLGFQLAQAQDSCNSAIPITAGTHTISIIDGTNIPVTGCSTAALAEWYTYTPTQNYSVTITSDLPVNLCKDTNFSVYTGTCNGLACYAQDDDGGTLICPNGNTSYLSTKTFEVMGGVTYYIAWDNQWNQTQGFDFQLIEAPIVPSPCLTATIATAGLTIVDAIDGNNVTTMCSNASQAKWYAYTPTGNYHVTVSSDLSVNLCKDTNFSVYTGSCTNGLTCIASDDNSGVLACNSGNTDSNLSKKTFDVNAGTTYYIVWDNRWSADGFNFEITEAPIIIPITYNTVNIPGMTGGYNMCIVDMNGDHKDDLVSVNNNNLRILFQGNAGALNPVDYPIEGASMMPSWSIAAGDMNKDGYNDLLLGAGSGLSFWKSNGLGTGYINDTPGDYIFCQRTNFADLNNDGHLDGFSCHDVAPNCYYLNDGENNFSFFQSTVTSGAMNFGSIGGNYATIFVDYDNDGDSDVLVSKCSGPPCELHRNDGNGIYTDVSAQAGINFTPVSSWSSAAADFDNDGDMDFLIGSNGFAPTRLYRNDLDTTNNTEEAFVDITLGSGWDTFGQTGRDYIAYDFDNDGWVDVMNGNSTIMFNNGDGSFSPTVYSGLAMGAVGDLNGDGFLDFLNNGNVKYGIPNGNNWIKVAIDGTASNSNGIGARVEIYGAFGKQIRDIRSGEGFGYMSSLNAHFGIGSATEVDQVIIRWPSGTVDVIENPIVNQMRTIGEGSAPLKKDDFFAAGLRIYPNPASDVLNIQSNKNVAIQSAQVFDLTGKLLIDTSVDNGSISVKKLALGTYILLLKDVNGSVYNQKFIKK